MTPSSARDADSFLFADSAKGKIYEEK